MNEAKRKRKYGRDTVDMNVLYLLPAFLFWSSWFWYACMNLWIYYRVRYFLVFYRLLLVFFVFVCKKKAKKKPRKYYCIGCIVILNYAWQIFYIIISEKKSGMVYGIRDVTTTSKNCARQWLCNEDDEYETRSFLIFCVVPRKVLQERVLNT